MKVLKKTQNELRVEVNGVGHTLCNLVQKRLLEDENVDLAGYDIPHPLASNPIIYVRTRGSAEPEEALRRAVKRTLETNMEFEKELGKALKN